MLGTKRRKALESIGGDVEPCDMFSSCANSPEFRRIEFAGCRDCRLANANGGSVNRWRPIDRRIKHPVLEQEKRDASRRRREAKAEDLQKKDRKRQEVARLAEKAERKTERIIQGSGGTIAATRNSGRLHRDGDHALQWGRGTVQLDTKLQSRSANPIVRLAELDKIRQDSVNAGAITGALVIRNKHGRGVVVFAEEDLQKLIDL